MTCDKFSKNAGSEGRFGSSPAGHLVRGVHAEPADVRLALYDIPHHDLQLPMIVVVLIIDANVGSAYGYALLLAERLFRSLFGILLLSLATRSSQASRRGGTDTSRPHGPGTDLNYARMCSSIWASTKLSTVKEVRDNLMRRI